MASTTSRPRLSLLAVTSLATIGGGLAGAPARASTGGQPGPTVNETLTATPRSCSPPAARRSPRSAW